MIQSGRFNQGDRLPATRELAGSLGLNRATVAAAYELLEAEGLIHGHVGRGSFVAARPAEPAGALPWERLLTTGAAPRLAAGDTVFSFSTSRPPEELFPLDAFRDTVSEVLDGGRLSSLLQLGSPYGYEPLRAWLLDQLHRQPSDDLLVVNGCQQALDLIDRVLVRAGDTVAIEDPVYPGLREVFSHARLIGLRLSATGLDLSVLERERPKLIVVTPNFQNPTGRTLPLEERRRLLAAAARAGAVVVENDIYSALRYTGADLPSLKLLDPSVIQLGSFSKISFPGLRVGWVLAPRPVTARLAGAKQRADLHTDQLSQAILLRFAESGRLEAHRRRVVEEGGRRLAAVLDACAEFLPEASEFTRPEGGMNLWLRLPGGLDAAELLARVRRDGVSYVPGSAFAVGEPDASALRLSFLGLPPDQIRRGVRILGTAAAAALRDSEPAPAMV